MMELEISDSHGHISELTNYDVPSIINQEPELESRVKIETVYIQEVKYELTDQEMKIEIPDLVLDESPNNVPKKCVTDDAYSFEDYLDKANLDYSKMKCCKLEPHEATEMKTNEMVVQHSDFEHLIHKKDQSSNSISPLKKRILKTGVNKRHKQNKLDTKEKILKCKYIPQISHVKSHLSKLKTYFNSEHTRKKIHRCEYCNYGCPFSSDLKRHINSKHTREKIHKCQYCDYGSPLMSNLNKHVNCKHTKAKIHECQYCDYRSPVMSNLKTHIAAKHTREMIHKCLYCDYVSPLISNLKKHTNSRHTKEEIHKCQYCDYESRVMQCLNSHINNKHPSGKTMHMCQYCDYGNPLMSRLKTHINYIHTREKIHKCQYCAYGTPDPSALKSHINCMHTREKIHKCQSCDYESPRMSNLKRHISCRHTSVGIDSMGVGTSHI